MLFFTSPAYSVPRMSTMPRSKSMPTNVSERTPAARPAGGQSPGLDHGEVGRWAARSSWVGRMKRVRANRHCQARSVTTRTGSRWAGEAPAKPSKTKLSPRLRWATALLEQGVEDLDRDLASAPVPTRSPSRSRHWPRRICPRRNGRSWRRSAPPERRCRPAPPLRAGWQLRPARPSADFGALGPRLSRPWRPAIPPVHARDPSR